MLYLNKILVPTDLSSSAHPLLLKALQLAIPFQAEIHVLYVQDTHEQERIHTKVTQNEDAFQSWFQEVIHYKAVLPLFNQLHPDQNLSRVHIQTDAVAPAILDYATRHDIDLIILGTFNPRPTPRTLGSVAEDIMRKAPCPTLSVDLQSPLTSASSQIEHILVPTDFSDCSQHALVHAKELAQQCNARLSLLHVVQPKSFLHASINPDLNPLIQHTMEPEVCKLHLANLYTSVPGPNVPVKYATVQGCVIEEINRYAETQKVDLVVLSSHGLTGLRHYLMGSVADNVIRHLQQPVFTVRAFQRSLVLASPSSFRQPSLTSYMTMLYDRAGTAEEAALPTTVRLEEFSYKPEEAPLSTSNLNKKKTTSAPIARTSVAP